MFYHGEGHRASKTVVTNTRLMAEGCPAGGTVGLLAPRVSNGVQVLPPHGVAEHLQLGEGVEIAIEVPEEELRHGLKVV